MKTAMTLESRDRIQADGPLTIRRMIWRKPELRQILNIERTSFNEFDAYSIEDFYRWYQYNPDLCCVAEIGGHIAGYVMLRILPGKGDLASLAIHPDFRRRGVGKALLEYVEPLVRDYGVAKIEIEVRTTNTTGLAFWEGMGFVRFGLLPKFYGDGEDAIQMRKMIA